jgi:hypothetical protein
MILRNAPLLQRIKSLTPASSPELSELTVSGRLTLVSRKLKQLSVDAKKQRQLEKLLQQLESWLKSHEKQKSLSRTKRSP